MRLQEGKRYVVKIEGARLHGWKPLSGGAMEGTGQGVAKGAELIFVGSVMGPGHDNIYQDTFRDPATGFVGSFSPASWGSAREGALGELRERSEALLALENCRRLGSHEINEEENSWCYGGCDTGQCPDCLRSTWWVERLSDYRHLEEPEAECFLVPAASEKEGAK